MSIIRNFIAKQLFKKGGSIANNKAVDFSTNALIKRLDNYNIKPTDITSEDQLLRVLSSVKQAEDNVFNNRFKGMMENNKFFNRQSDNVVDLKNKKLDTEKPILGGTQETDEQILKRLNKENEDSINRLKNKKDPPEELAGGGVAGLLGERPGYNKGLKVQGSGSISGKQDMYSIGEKSAIKLPKGITSNTSFVNFIASLDIPISEKISLLGDIQYNKSRNKIEKGDEELFIEDPASYINKKIGIGINQGNEGFSGSAKYDVDSGEPEFNILFKKSFAGGGVAGLLGERPGFGGGGTSGATDRGYQGGGRNKSGGVSGTAPGAAPGPGGNNNDGPKGPPRVINPPPKTKVKKNISTGSFTPTFNFFKKFAAHDRFTDQLKARRGKNYHELGGLDFMARFPDINPSIAKGLASAYQNIFEYGRAVADGPGGITFEDADKRAKEESRLNAVGIDAFANPDSSLYQEYTDMVPESGAVQMADGGPARQNFKMGKRAFLKLLGSGVAGIAGLKSGLLGFGKKEAAKKAVTETVKQSAGSGTVPPYFLNLVKKIKALGDDAPRLATKDREKVTTYKDYTLIEDVTTGEQTIQRMKVTDDGSEAYYGQPLTEETYMSYKPGKGQMDETTKGKTPPDEYEEGTALLRNDKGNTGEIVDESPNISDDVIEEGTVFEDNMTEFSKADGGRIGYSAGSKVIGKGIMAGINKLFGKPVITTADKIKRPQKALDREMFKKFETNYPETGAADATLNIPVQQEGKFTKAEYLIQRLENTIKGNPNDKYVQDTFPNFIKELKDNPELAKNENVFKELGGDLPEGQQIVVYGDDSIDFFTQKSGPKNIDRIKKIMSKYNISKDKALKIMKMEPNDQVMEFKMLEIANRKLNATGGLANMLGE